MYNFMKEIPVYIFLSEKNTVNIDLQCFIIDKSWRVWDGNMSKHNIVYMSITINNFY